MKLVDDPLIAQKLEELYRDAEQRNRNPQITSLNELYMALSPEQGRFLHDLIIENNCRNIVEFGCSFGISALFFAAAAKKSGAGIITTELVAQKASAAIQHFAAAAVLDLIDLREGDALETLKEGVENIDFLLLDGWKDVYLPLLLQLEPKLADGAHIYLDNADMSDVQPVLQYISEDPRFASQSMHGGKGVLARFNR